MVGSRLYSISLVFIVLPEDELVSILLQPEDRMQVTPAESRRIMQGIARAHGKAQRQAKPLTAEALAAVKATAKSRHPLEDGKRQESAERASWRGRVDVA